MKHGRTAVRPISRAQRRLIITTVLWDFRGVLVAPFPFFSGNYAGEERDYFLDRPFSPTPQ